MTEANLGREIEKEGTFCLAVTKTKTNFGGGGSLVSIFSFSSFSVCLTFILGTFNINIISGYITADSSLSGQTEHANGSQLIMMSLLVVVVVVVVAGANVTAT